MGGTSTDVCHYAGELERTYETEVAGVRVRAPMMLIHTVAAGGGSILHFDGSRLTVGPDSAGADPGPACYGNGGPLTITDCNVMLGKLQPELFPHVFGPGGDGPLDAARTSRQIMLAQDRCLRTHLVAYGGKGYAYVLTEIVPQLLDAGVTQGQIDDMLIENPKRIFAV